MTWGRILYFFGTAPIGFHFKPTDRTSFRTDNGFPTDEGSSTDSVRSSVPKQSVRFPLPSQAEKSRIYPKLEVM